MATEVRHLPEQHRYAIEKDGVQAGFTQYEDRPGLVAFMHTEIDEAYAGQGLASQLIKAALDDVRAQEKGVLPYCPFVLTYIQKHPEYLDLVPADRRERFQLPAA